MAIEYQKGASLLHGFDARTKLLMFVAITIAAVVIADPILMAVLFFCLYWLGTRAIEVSELNQNLRSLVVIFITFSFFQIIFFTPKDSHFLFYLIPFTDWIPVTVEGIIRGVAVFFRFFSVVLAVHLMLYTTPPVELALTITERGKRQLGLNDLVSTIIIGAFIVVSAVPMMSNRAMLFFLPADTASIVNNSIIIVLSFLVAFAIQRVMSRGLPSEMGVALMLGFSTVGILSKQTQKITDAQKARGYDVKPKNLIRRIQVLTALLIPIFMTTMERSQDISIAILSRGFDYNITKRTFRREFAYQKNDFIFMTIMFLVILTGMTLNNLGMGNFTEQAIFRLIK